MSSPAGASPWPSDTQGGAGEPVLVAVEQARRALRGRRHPIATPPSSQALAVGVSTTTQLESAVQPVTRIEKQLPTGQWYG